MKFSKHYKLTHASQARIIMKSCEKQGFHSVQIIKENHTLISIFPTQ